MSDRINEMHISNHYTESSMSDRNMDISTSEPYNQTAMSYRAKGIPIDDPYNKPTVADRMNDNNNMHIRNSYTESPMPGRTKRIPVGDLYIEPTMSNRMRGISFGDQFTESTISRRTKEISSGHPYNESTISGRAKDISMDDIYIESTGKKDSSKGISFGGSYNQPTMSGRDTRIFIGDTYNEPTISDRNREISSYDPYRGATESYRSKVISMNGSYKEPPSSSVNDGIQMGVSYNESMMSRRTYGTSNDDPSSVSTVSDRKREILSGHSYNESTISAKNKGISLGDPYSESTISDRTREISKGESYNNSIIQQGNSLSSSKKSDAKNPKLYLALVAELLGTMFLVLVSCGSAAPWDAVRYVRVSLTFAFSVATIVWNIGHLSGGHINPAVTFTFMLTRRISVMQGALYVACQCIGAICGAGILQLVSPESLGFDGLGTSGPGTDVTTAQALVIELLITFVLLWAVFATIDRGRIDHNGSGPLAIGLAIGMCHLWAVPYTGAGMNPARVLGPAVISDTWTDHWVYWIGPLIGGALAGFLYDFLMATNACPRKFKAFFNSNYDPDKRYQNDNIAHNVYNETNRY